MANSNGASFHKWLAGISVTALLGVLGASAAVWGWWAGDMTTMLRDTRERVIRLEVQVAGITKVLDEAGEPGDGAK
jgi:hypothetical protein